MAVGVGKFKLSAGARKQGRIIEAAYYPSQITKIEHKLSKNKESMNHWISFKILEGEHEGVNLQLLINEKGLDESTGAPGAKIAAELMGALNISGPENEDIEIPWEDMVNQKLDVYSKPGKDQRDQSTNEVSGFKPYSGTV